MCIFIKLTTTVCVQRPGMLLFYTHRQLLSKLCKTESLKSLRFWICTDSPSVENVQILLSICLSVSSVGPTAPQWCVIKQVVVISKKWKSFFFLCVSASQRGEAYSTPWNWCLINLPFLMWDVVTWSYFFPSFSAEDKKTKNTKAFSLILSISLKSSQE